MGNHRMRGRRTACNASGWHFTRRPMQRNILTISCTALHLSTPPGRTPPVRRDDEPNGTVPQGPGPESSKSR